MELIKQALLYYHVVLDAASAPEVSAEMIVPDMYPDMSDIVDTVGQACVKETSLRDDRLDLTGLARIGVLYMPEGEDGLRKLDVAIPFNHVFDGRFPAGSEAHCEAKLLEAEVRAVNPRKISVLARLSIHAAVYSPAELAVPLATSEPCEVKLQSCAAYIPAAVKTKSFTVNETLELPASRPPAEEFIIALPRMEVTDVKAVGSKVVFKGAALLSILYLSGGEPVRVEDEISISQIMDMDGLEEGATVDLDLRVTGIELDTDFMSGDGRGISIALHVDAHAVAHSERKIEAIVDLYSTAAYLRPVMEPLSLTELGERGTRRQTIREVIETEPDVRNVIDTRICLGPVTQLESGELGCEAFASLFYQTDDGRYRSADQKIAVPAGVEADSVSARLAGDITSAPSSGGIELRFSVDFSTVTTKTSRLTVVGAVEEEEARERAVKPSVVLRRCQPGEGLWEIAKQYSTTINELCLANGLDDCESPQDGRLLLIPKKR